MCPTPSPFSPGTGQPHEGDGWAAGSGLAGLQTRGALRVATPWRRQFPRVSEPPGGKAPGHRKWKTQLMPTRGLHPELSDRPSCHLEGRFSD